MEKKLRGKNYEINEFSKIIEKLKKQENSFYVLSWIEVSDASNRNMK